MDDEYRDHVARINKRLADRADAQKKASQPADFGERERGEVTVLKKTDGRYQLDAAGSAQPKDRLEWVRKLLKKGAKK